MKSLQKVKQEESIEGKGEEGYFVNGLGRRLFKKVTMPLRPEH